MPVALTIAGSDPSGGAGIQADLKTFHQFQVYGEAVLTLLTVQNTRTVSRVEVLDPGLVREQIEAVVSDIPPGAAKTGALGNAAIVEEVASVAKSFRFPLVVDPVMVSKHGASLMNEEAQIAIRQLLLPHAALITPNLPEAAILTGLSIHNIDDMKRAAEALLQYGAKAVLIKGGHLEGEAVDILLDGAQFHTFPAPRLHTANTHGTGCTYSAAITALLARTVPLSEAVRQAKAYVHRAIETNPGLGKGSGPVNHFA
ncbi:MAG: bifunctional hydroxymethylpyrimidine kinase/phosphomethylpyrimidine kinase [Bryobacteraceae bacterium]|nr:bifunctional hydroxymethylpyrimidine kinase/phosphomethylpyrimidine kinase [Bryobacteraceae bacterium]